MGTFADQEYWDLCQRLVNQQYSDEEDYYELDSSLIPDSVWLPAEHKEKMLPDYNGVIDLTTAKGSQVINRIHTCRNFKIGQCLIKITKYKGESSGIKLDLIIYEENRKKKQTANFNVVNKLDIAKDSRFATRDWLHYFNSATKAGKDVPLEKMADIVRWLQAIQKMKAYL